MAVSSRGTVVQIQFDELLDDNDAARLLGVKVQTLAVWRMTGRYALPFVRVGRAIRYRRQDIDTWLATRTVVPGKPELQSV
jgi:excisionase family DNA binding protein